MSKRNRNDHEFKVQAVKLALEIGQTKAGILLGAYRLPYKKGGICHLFYRQDRAFIRRLPYSLAVGFELSALIITFMA
mgnify:CR=1 FL=1